jgi:hypothetical protein
MKTLTIQINNATLARLQRSAGRDGITLDGAILDGIGAYIQADEDANACDENKPSTRSCSLLPA